MKKRLSPDIHVGILKAERIQLQLEGRFRIHGKMEDLQGSAEALLNAGNIEIIQNGKKSVFGNSVTFYPVDKVAGRFVINDVVIGIGFHWEQKEDQKFQGALKLKVVDQHIQVINIISVEDYLISVISSEMSADSSPGLLKAHTIISRSWLLAQIEKQDSLVAGGSEYALIHKNQDEYIRWYDREDHKDFHVCADDHCQRYQGMTRAYNPEVVHAVTETSGEVLVYAGRICDARFSKCCGGVTELFEYCWEPVSHPYLRRVEDNPVNLHIPPVDLKIEANAVKFIERAPEAFCNTCDAELLQQVLNDYDQTSKDFYRWEVTYSQQELSGLIREKSGIDFGEIEDLIPVQRGESGRLVKLKIKGTKKTLTIGKELEIRRWLSSSHLYSSAFTVEKRDIRNQVPGQFILHGAGWGHGVGLCQIGAAVMASRGYTHKEILMHYFKDATIEKRYEQRE
ncbi:MAG: SpoIID/LytB domain-containing protein [Bacteroidales bacterium]|nr:SpoIID/LytB domain-containing protein [Bacteroidales bacterium]